WRRPVGCAPSWHPTGSSSWSTRSSASSSRSAWTRCSTRSWRCPVLTPTDEEERLLEQLTPEWWTANGMKDVLITRSEMTREKLEDKRDRLRLILDVEDDHPLVILPGGRARRAKLAVRTRRVTEEMDMLWHPGRRGLGADSVTGETVDIPFTSQLQVSGA